MGIYAKMVSGQYILCVCSTNMGFTLHLQIHHITLAFGHSSCNVLHFIMLQNTFVLLYTFGSSLIKLITATTIASFLLCTAHESWESSKCLSDDKLLILISSSVHTVSYMVLPSFHTIHSYLLSSFYSPHPLCSEHKSYRKWNITVTTLMWPPYYVVHSFIIH